MILILGRAARVAALVILLQIPHVAFAGNCLSRADGFQLTSDTVHWTLTIHAGLECLQGLRGGAMLIDEVKIVEPPSAGSLTIAGTAFVYKAPATNSTDHFRLRISGENHRIRGMSEVVVDVSIRQ